MGDDQLRAETQAMKPPRQFSLFEFDHEPDIEETKSRSRPVGKFSNFVVYVDESGNHGMQNVDPDYPLFVLAFCIFYKKHYSEKVVPALQKFKFNHFGHDIIILHERDIRKEKGPFKLASARHRNEFLGELTDIIDRSNFILVSCVIDKTKLQQLDPESANLYHLALGFCLETLYEFMEEKGQADKRTHVIFECRGKNEDRDLELEFRRICAGANKRETVLPFDVVMADKKANSAGLQLADLVARPVGLHVLRPMQTNRAFNILKRKFFCSGGRPNVGTGFQDWGLKIYPSQ
ncbi:MAG: DUF3800 domain-containing protein [Sphingopyxis sp.]|nr:DUF3800 domain-containing protein [Sphingopyxis sp.]